MALRDASSVEKNWLCAVRKMDFLGGGRGFEPLVLEPQFFSSCDAGKFNSTDS